MIKGKLDEFQGNAAKTDLENYIRREFLEYARIFSIEILYKRNPFVFM